MSNPNKYEKKVGIIVKWKIPTTDIQWLSLKCEDRFWIPGYPDYMPHVTCVWDKSREEFVLRINDEEIDSGKMEEICQKPANVRKIKDAKK
jgi:hypothetical protein